MQDQLSINLPFTTKWQRALARAGILTIAAFYAYGAAVHVMNMLSLTGFDWGASPIKWQVLDWVYLVLDLIVATGLMLNWKVGFVCFFCAAFSQIGLYTAFRSWIVDVPVAFRRSPEELAYLDTLVIFHCVTILVMIACLSILAAKARTEPSSEGN